MELIQPYILGWLVPTVLGGLLGYVIGLYKKVKAAKDAAEDREKVEKESLKKQIAELQEDMDVLTIMSCRTAIYDEHFSVDEKVDAYRVYRSKGGNHQTKKYMSDLLGEDADAYLARHSE